MCVGKTVFAQLLSLTSGYNFRTHVERYQGNKGVRRLSCRIYQLLTKIDPQLDEYINLNQLVLFD
jgi:hypothetical protein